MKLFIKDLNGLVLFYRVNYFSSFQSLIQLPDQVLCHFFESSACLLAAEILFADIANHFL